MAPCKELFWFVGLVGTYPQGRIYEFLEGGGGSGQEFFKGGLGSSKRQVRGNFHTDKQIKTSEWGLNPWIRH